MSMRILYGRNMGAGTTFRLGKQKLVKSNQDNEIQSTTLCNMHFSKKPQKLENFREFKSNLIGLVCKVSFNCKLQKNLGSRMY